MESLRTVSIVKQNGVKVMLVTNGSELSEVLLAVEQAIRGAGFNPDGNLEFVEDE